MDDRPALPSTLRVNVDPQKVGVVVIVVSDQVHTDFETGRFEAAIVSQGSRSRYREASKPCYQADLTARAHGILQVREHRRRAVPILGEAGRRAHAASSREWSPPFPDAVF
jgi:hypothetical protein